MSADAENGGAPDEPDAGEDFALVTVGRYRSPIEAQAYRMAIEQAGLRAWVSDENMGTTFGPVIGTGLEVRARDEEAALAILERKTEPRAEAAPPPPEPSPDHGRRSPVLERLELAGVLLITTAYPIASNLVGHPGDGPTSPRRLMVSACWYAGLTIILWILLRSRQDPLSPAPLPRSLNQWMREIFVGAMLFLGLCWGSAARGPWSWRVPFSPSCTDTGRGRLSRYSWTPSSAMGSSTSAAGASPAWSLPTGSTISP